MSAFVQVIDGMIEASARTPGGERDVFQSKDPKQIANWLTRNGFFDFGASDSLYYPDEDGWPRREDLAAQIAKHMTLGPDPTPALQ